jgi:hypothetical protein
MDKKINELKLEDIQAVVGGIVTAATMVAPKTFSASASFDKTMTASASSLQALRAQYGV